MKTKHTPGPWFYRIPPSSLLTTRVIETEDGKTVALVGMRDFTNGVSEDVANACLISLAPEMLEALRKIHQFWCCPPPKRMKDWSARCDVMAYEAHQILSKLEGRE